MRRLCQVTGSTARCVIWLLIRTSGLIIVYTGILPVCQDEQGLAAVLAHGTLFPVLQFLCLLTSLHSPLKKSDMSVSPSLTQHLANISNPHLHSLVARHTAERISSRTVLVALMVLFQFTLGIDFGISDIVQKLLLELPNSRTQELEGTI